MPYEPMNRSELIQRRRRQRRATSGPHIGKWTLRLGAGCLLAILAFFGFLFFGAAASLAGVYAYFAQGLPDPSAIQTQQSTYQTVKIYDRTGQHLLYESIDPRPFRGDRTYLTIDQIPILAREATIALEDRNFYTNLGVNFSGLGRALINDLRGNAVQGGSSITQQLVKLTLIDPKDRYRPLVSRKIREVIMALDITRKYPGKQGKDQILEWYLNLISYGNAAYGIEAASQVYYNKPVSELSLDEIAVLAAIPEYPGLNPLQAPADAYSRQRAVLQAMVDSGYITDAQAQKATRYFNTPLLNDLVGQGLLTDQDLPLVATGDRPATARALNAMVKAGMLTQAEADAAKKLTTTLWQYTRESAEQRYQIPPDAPHFALYVLNQIEQKYNTAEDPYYIWENGLQVYTTLDWNLQVYAECVARSHIASVQMKQPKPCQGGLQNLPTIPQLLAPGQQYDHQMTNAAVVAIRPPTGEVLAMVGSLDYFDDSIDGQVNVAVSPRQPGSSFKPYTYLTAFESGNYSPSTFVMDVRTVFPDAVNGPYVPENYDRTYHGPQMLRWALQRSYNIPAVWLMSQVGVGNVIRTARKAGVSSLDKELSYYGLALTLGGGEITLLDHTYGYSVFANGGIMAGQPVPDDEKRPGYRDLDPVFVLEVRDKDGNTLERYDKPTTERVFDPAPVYMLNNVLSDPSPRPIAFGSYADYLVLPDRPVAAKTGTTNDYKDDWTLGYTPQLVIGVWTGNSDDHPMAQSTGSLGAAPIWHAIMVKAMAGQPVETWQEPPGIQHATVCVPSGLLPTPDCPQTTDDIFLTGHTPTQKDDMFQGFEINKNNGKLASPCTPPDAVVRQVYQIFPPSAADWVRTQKDLPQPPTDEDGPCSAVAASTGDVAITGPIMGGSVRGTVPITGTARGANFRAYTLEVASQSKPDEWTPIGGAHNNQVTNGLLEIWNTAGFDGLYHLRLTVTKNDGSVETTDTQVVVDNEAPKVKIIHPQKDDSGKDPEYVMEEDEVVNITADATDTWAMDRVEFYLDGKMIGETSLAPYSIAWTITMVGDGPETHTITAKAYNKAGNSTQSDPVTFIVKHQPPDTPTPTPTATPAQ